MHDTLTKSSTVAGIASISCGGMCRRRGGSKGGGCIKGMIEKETAEVVITLHTEACGGERRGNLLRQ